MIKRAHKKNKKTSTVACTITKNQLAKAVNEALNDAINTSMMFMFIIPIKVMMDHYWQDSYKEKVPEFADYIIEYYTKWQDGEYSIEELEKELWDLAGIKIMECER